MKEGRNKPEVLFPRESVEYLDHFLVVYHWEDTVNPSVIVHSLHRLIHPLLNQLTVEVMHK